MIPSTMRRVAAGAPHTSSALISNLTPVAIRITPAAVALAYNPSFQQRRRYSSSKPSSPNDSPKNIPDGQVTTAPTSTKRGGRRKAKDSLVAQQANLPSVPSTHHVPHEALALSTFFSLHRPMSVTHSFPKTISDDAFAQIFAARPKANYNDVVSTLSRTVDDLQQPLESMGLGDQQEADAMMDNANEAGMHKIDVRNPDGSESSVYVQLNAMSGQYLPFRPPPLPQPRLESAAASEVANAASTEVAQDTPDHRVYKAIFTLEETREQDGEIKIVAHSPQIIEDGAPRTFLERMALRQVRRREARDEGRTMYAISVKRQRKLKMKKMKYKRLMKKTRNLRRKLDRV
ncbi:mitochondrial mRNA-processing protein COX24 [Microdochium nivale]|nr:mitochondrial mRNA-processing protein COX24 [Microdochium nivale]